MNEWLPVIGTLLGAIVGGTIAFLISARQLKHQSELDERKRQLSNFEGIHKVLSSIASQTGALSTLGIMHLTHGVKMSASSSGEKFPLDEAKMLVDFYAPSLRPDLNVIEAQWMILGRAIAEMMLTEKKTDEKVADLIVTLTTSSAEIAKASEAAKTKLTALVMRYSHAV